MSLISKRAQGFEESPTLALAARANELKAQGKDIISLTVGEPDWPTYEKAAEAGIAAIRTGKTKYTPASGTPALKAAIKELTQDLLGQSYAANEITVSTGAKFIIFAAFQALLDEGDEVIIPTPYWASYAEMVRLAGGRPVLVKTQEQNRFKITAEEFTNAITSKTKVFLLNSPSNPTGVEYSKDDLSQIVTVLNKNPQIAVVSDDIYNQLSFAGKGISPHLLHIDPSLRSRMVCINGASKAYSMTGWRIGWATGDKEIIKAMASYQSQTVGAPSSISQEATLAAIRDCKSDVSHTREVLKERFRYAFEAFKTLPRCRVIQPDGAFYLWINVSEALKHMNFKTAHEFSHHLIDKVGVVTVPGDDFGDPNFIRISYAVPREHIDLAVERISKAIQ